MSEVRIRENESLESALKRFKRQCARSGSVGGEAVCTVDEVKEDSQ